MSPESFPHQKKRTHTLIWSWKDGAHCLSSSSEMHQLRTLDPKIWGEGAVLGETRSLGSARLAVPAAFNTHMRIWQRFANTHYLDRVVLEYRLTRTSLDLCWQSVEHHTAVEPALGLYNASSGTYVAFRSTFRMGSTHPHDPEAHENAISSEASANQGSPR